MFVHNAVLHGFRAIVHRFLSKKRRKIEGKDDAFFQCSACFFEHGDPHEILYFTIWKLLLRFLSFCFFFKQMLKKTIEKFTCQKNRKMTSRGPQNGPKIVKKRSKNRWKCQQMPKRFVSGSGFSEAPIHYVKTLRTNNKSASVGDPPFTNRGQWRSQVECKRFGISGSHENPSFVVLVKCNISENKQKEFRRYLSILGFFKVGNVVKYWA